MIDIHCHLLYGVDDGPDTFEESCAMLREAKAQGVREIILTPHYRHGMFPYNKEDIYRHFLQVQKYAMKNGIRVYLGTEYHVDSRCVEFMKKQRCLSLANSDYILCEYSGNSEYSYVRDMTKEQIFSGFLPVIAHAERYGCLMCEPELVRELRDMGALIQINADSVLGMNGRTVKHFCKYLLKHNMADIVASDSHGIKDRPCRMGKCREYIKKKYGLSAAIRLFEITPQRIVEKLGE